MVWRWMGNGRLAGMILLAVLLALRIADSGPLQKLRYSAFDYYQRIAPRAAEPMPVTILDIDDTSLAELGQWPWPRTRVAELVTRVAEAGAVALAFDVVFAEPDRLSPARLAEVLPDLPPDMAAALSAAPGNDAALAAAMGSMPVVLGQTSVRNARVAPPAPGEIVPTPHAILGPDPAPFLLSFPDLVQNLPELEAAAAGRGVFTVRPDLDGIYRRLPMVLVVAGQKRLGLAPELLRVATGGDAFAIRSNAAGVEEVVLGGQAIPTDGNGLIWPHYAPSDQARFVSAADLLAGRVPEGRMAGHLVLLGTSAIGLEDFRPTPLGVPMAGVEIQAQILENILSGSFLKRPGFAIGAELSTVALLGLGIVLLVPALGAAAIVALTAVSLLGYQAFSFWLFAERQSLLDPTFPALALILTFMLMAMANYLREERQRQQIRSAFGQYVSPDLVEQLQANPDALQLGGETRELTVLFTDVRGFTALAEAHRDRPDVLTRTMNEMLTTLSQAVLAEGGTIDKFMGDSVMAFWNAPLERRDHVAAAARAALRMQNGVAALNRTRTAAGLMPLDIGIGLNTGPAIVGNMGSAMRFDYTALGDTVNLAARLEGQAATYGVGIVLGRATAEALGPTAAVIEIDLLRVKGKSEPERVHALFGDETMARTPAFGDLARDALTLRTAYRAQDWTRAEAALPDLTQSADALGLDLTPLATLYRRRIATRRAAPPDPEWDGAESAETK